MASGMAGSTSFQKASIAPRPCIIPAGRASAQRWKCSLPSPQREKCVRATPGIDFTAALSRCISGPSAERTSSGASSRRQCALGARPPMNGIRIGSKPALTCHTSSRQIVNSDRRQ
jgi:hypothetical protein